MPMTILVLFMVITLIFMCIFAVIEAIKRREIFPIVFFCFFGFVLLFFGPLVIKLTYNDYLKMKAASVAESDLNNRYNLDNLEVWYGVEDFSFTDGKKDCIGKLTKQDDDYDIARKPNGEPDVECTIEKKVSWQPTNRAN